MLGYDATQQLIEQIKSSPGQSFQIIGNNSKADLGREISGQALQLSEHHGVLNYDPRELVITARAGTPLSEIHTTLDDANQMLAFEPPSFGEATLGGTIACGLSGPRRPFVGSARDFVLGCSVLNGHGEVMKFGGQVMKNVAGHDVSRLMVGAYGTLGVMLDISLKVLPKPTTSTTLCRECSEADALQTMSDLRSKALPVDAACYYKGQLYLRLSGSELGVQAALTKVPGEPLSGHSHFWLRLNEQNLKFFDRPKPLWRIAVKPATPALDINGDWLYDWGGVQPWLFSDEPDSAIRNKVAAVGGHASVFRGGDRQGEVLQRLPKTMLALQQRIKHSFDPEGVFNLGKMYAEI